MFFGIKRLPIIVLLYCFFWAGRLLDSKFTINSEGYRGAFVIPLMRVQNKKFILVGRESGGKDKGMYCVPGGSSGWWIFRDTNPLDTAAREFCEETLTDLTYGKVRAHIDMAKKAMFVDMFNAKKIVSYLVPFKKKIIDDIIKKFFQRRQETWFWQYYYREMDCFALVDLKDLIRACTYHDNGRGVKVEGLLYDPSALVYKKSEIIIRPILEAIVKKHAKVLILKDY